MIPFKDFISNLKISIYSYEEILNLFESQESKIFVWFGLNIRLSEKGDSASIEKINPMRAIMFDYSEFIKFSDYFTKIESDRKEFIIFFSSEESAKEYYENTKKIVDYLIKNKNLPKALILKQ